MVPLLLFQAEFIKRNICKAKGQGGSTQVFEKSMPFLLQCRHAKKKYHRCQRMSEGASSCSIIVVSSHLVHCEGGVGPGRAPSADCTVCANEAVRASNLCKAKWCGVLSGVDFGRAYPLRKLTAKRP